MASYFVVAGLLIHLILVYAIFDIYYTSPVVSGVTTHNVISSEAPARRLVVISADGLRYRTFSSRPELSPFLHSIINERKGVHGISRSHVPTESRPGHVAIFAGFTEDVSAVARGWKKNPVPFDSVFNRSTEAWIWGSPDIVTLFNDHPHVHSYSYSAEEEDFTSSTSHLLDEWVFKNVENFLVSALSDPKIMERISAPRIVFFLHLLGIDTNGHGFKPNSEQYLNNVRVVDSGIKRMQSLFDRVFPDKKTAWLFTSDHGMTDWGSHGAGDDDEVLTPYVSWGAGLQNGGARRTISQVDLAPLMASLIGTATPVNSIGILPIQLLETTPAYQFKAAYNNFLQLKEQLLVVKNKKSARIGFIEYEKFGDRALAALEKELLKLAKLKRHASSATLFYENAPLMKKAIYYYHRYDRSFLGAAISVTFIAWIATVWAFVTTLPMDSPTFYSLKPKKAFLLLSLTAIIFCIYCQFPWTNFIYVLLPLYLLALTENISNGSERMVAFARNLILNYQTASLTFLLKPFIMIVATSVILFFFVMTFIDRRCLFLIFLGLMIAPSCYPENETVKKSTRTWLMCCLLLLPFPFFPTVGKYEIPMLCVLSPLIMAIFANKFSALLDKSYLNKLSIICVASSALIVLSQYIFETVPAWIRLCSWISIPVALLTPLFTSTNVIDRLTIFAVTLFVPYSLLSIAYESLFLLIFYPLLMLFLRFEFGHLSDAQFNSITSEPIKIATKFHGKVMPFEIRRTVLCVSFVLAALFGTGNFASMNSFSPSTLKLFISVFSPFTMATLLITKLTIPVMVVALVCSSILRFDRNSVQRFTCLVLIFTDLMAMCFFHQLKDDGSWLDIGLSISQYLVSMVLSIVLLIFLLLSSHLMKFQISIDNFSVLFKPKPKDSCL